MGSPRTTAETADELRAMAHEKIAEGHVLLARAHRATTTQATDAWLSMAEAGEIAGKTPRATRDGLIRDGVKLGGAGRSPRVKRSDLERWIASNAVQGSADRVTVSPREAARAAVAARALRVAL